MLRRRERRKREKEKERWQWRKAQTTKLRQTKPRELQLYTERSQEERLQMIAKMRGSKSIAYAPGNVQIILAQKDVL
jgi:hypothetical protein